MDNLDKLRFIGIIKDGLFTGPAIVTFHLTNVCNLKCIYCLHHTPYKKNNIEVKKQELNLEVFKKVIDDCRRMNVRQINLSAQGEPTLHTRIADIINYVEKKNFVLSFFTNATFDRNLLEYVKKANEIKITLSSSNSAQYKKIQSQASRDIFQRVVKNIFSLTANKNNRKTSNIQINYILNSENYADLPNIFKLANDLKVDFLKIILPELSPYTEKISIKKEVFTRINTIFKKIIKQPYFKKIRNNVLSDYLVKKKFLDNSAPSKIRSCFIGWYYAFINFDGEVGPCCNFKKILSVGNVYNDSFKSIWHSKAFHKLRLAGKYSLFNHKFSVCNDCLCFRNFNNKIEQQLNKFQKHNTNDSTPLST